VEPGSLTLAFGVAFAFVTSLFVETRLLLRFRSDWYFLPGFPLGPRLVPIARPPEGHGRTRSVRWEVSAPNLVRFWADPNERVAPSGLHGVIVMAQGRNGVELEVRWAPPWTPFLAMLWLALLGAARGDGLVTVPVAVLIGVGVLLVYGERARSVAAELRWSFVRGAEGDPPDPDVG
jgi:hypothetical protein